MDDSAEKCKVSPTLCFMVNTILAASPSGSGPPTLHRCWSCAPTLQALRGCFENQQCWLTQGRAGCPRAHTAGWGATSRSTPRGRCYLGGWLSLDPVKKRKRQNLWGISTKLPSLKSPLRSSFLTRTNWLERSAHFIILKIKFIVWTIKIKTTAAVNMKTT